LALAQADPNPGPNWSNWSTKEFELNNLKSMVEWERKNASPAGQAYWKEVDRKRSLPPAAPATKSLPSAQASEARAAVAKMVNLGLIKRMDVKTGTFYIDGPLWEEFELDGMENIVKVISGYRDAAHGLPQVTLYESRSGKELASYGVFLGVTIQ
jgi:hypothetical protein